MKETDNKSGEEGVRREGQGGEPSSAHDAQQVTLPPMGIQVCPRARDAESAMSRHAHISQHPQDESNHPARSPLQPPIEIEAQHQAPSNSSSTLLGSDHCICLGPAVLSSIPCPQHAGQQQVKGGISVSRGLWRPRKARRPLATPLARGPGRSVEDLYSTVRKPMPPKRPRGMSTTRDRVSTPPLAFFWFGISDRTLRCAQPRRAARDDDGDNNHNNHNNHNNNNNDNHDNHNSHNNNARGKEKQRPQPLTLTERDVGIIAKTSSSSGSGSGSKSSGRQNGMDFNWRDYLDETIDTTARSGKTSANPSIESFDSGYLTPVTQTVPKLTLSEPSGGKHSQSRGADVKVGNSNFRLTPSWREAGPSQSLRKTASDVLPRNPQEGDDIVWKDADDSVEKEHEIPMLAMMREQRQRKLTPSRRYMGDSDSDDDDREEWLDEYKPTSRRLEFTQGQSARSRSKMPIIQEAGRLAIGNVSGTAKGLEPVEGHVSTSTRGSEAHMKAHQYQHQDNRKRLGEATSTNPQRDLGSQDSLESLEEGQVWQAQDATVLNTLSSRLELGQESTVGNDAGPAGVSHEKQLLNAYRMAFAGLQRTGGGSFNDRVRAAQALSGAVSTGMAASGQPVTTTDGSVIVSSSTYRGTSGTTQNTTTKSSATQSTHQPTATTMASTGPRTTSSFRSVPAWVPEGPAAPVNFPTSGLTSVPSGQDEVDVARDTSVAKVSGSTLRPQAASFTPRTLSSGGNAPSPPPPESPPAGRTVRKRGPRSRPKFSSRWKIHRYTAEEIADRYQHYQLQAAGPIVPQFQQPLLPAIQWPGHIGQNTPPMEVLPFQQPHFPAIQWPEHIGQNTLPTGVPPFQPRRPPVIQPRGPITSFTLPTESRIIFAKHLDMPDIDASERHGLFWAYLQPSDFLSRVYGSRYGDGKVLMFITSPNRSEVVGLVELMGPWDQEAHHHDLWVDKTHRHGSFPVRWILRRRVHFALFAHLLVGRGRDRPVTDTPSWVSVPLPIARQAIEIFLECPVVCTTGIQPRVRRRDREAWQAFPAGGAFRSRLADAAARGPGDAAPRTRQVMDLVEEAIAPSRAHRTPARVVRFEDAVGDSG
ncbi:MAG: hypothetical protein M1823_000871 [Watsoniomyces obsoletus]|nr:MAG: hypothetical protein M1823_000871 [Watsoniomyces obsoletus]